MSAIRVAFQISRDSGDHHDLLAYTATARAADGCLEAECYRGYEDESHVALISIWRDEYAFSAHWQSLVDSGDARRTVLRSGGGDADRTSFEFYRQTIYSFTGDMWCPRTPDEARSLIMWGAGGAVRVIGKSTRDIAATRTDLIGYSEETRREPGCLQFEHFGSVEPDSGGDCVTFELWADQVLYDRHYSLRIRSQAVNARYSRGGTAARPPRKYGSDGYEFYRYAGFTHLYGTWRPERPEHWSDRVLWTF